MTNNPRISYENDVDFDEWSWGSETDAVSESAARFVLKQIVLDSTISFSLHKETSTAIFAAIDHQLSLEFSLVAMMKEWIDTRGSSIKEDTDCIKEATILLRDLETCVALLHEKLGEENHE